MFCDLPWRVCLCRGTETSEKYFTQSEAREYQWLNLHNLPCNAGIFYEEMVMAWMVLCSLLPTGVVPIWSAALRWGRWRWGRLRSATLIEIFPRPQEKTGMWTSRRQLCCFTGTHPANSPWVSGQHSLHNCAWAFSLMCSGQYVAYQPDCRSIRCVPLPYRVSLVPSPLLVAMWPSRAVA